MLLDQDKPKSTLQRMHFISCVLNSKDQDILNTNVNLYNSINSVPKETQGDFLSKWVVPFFCNINDNNSFLYVITIQIEAATQTMNVQASWVNLLFLKEK